MVDAPYVERKTVKENVTPMTIDETIKEYEEEIK